MLKVIKKADQTIECYWLVKDSDAPPGSEVLGEVPVDSDGPVNSDAIIVNPDKTLSIDPVKRKALIDQQKADLQALSDKEAQKKNKIKAWKEQIKAGSLSAQDIQDVLKFLLNNVL